VSSFINLLIIFPIVIDRVTGGLAARIIRLGHVRAPLLVAVIAGLSPGAGQLAVYGTRYATFEHRLPQIRAELAWNGGGDARASLDELLQTKDRAFRVRGLLLVSSRVGVDISDDGAKGFTLTGVGYWIYLGVEMQFVARHRRGAGLVGGVPYCESCKQWYDLSEVVGSGSGEKAVTNRVIARLDHSRWCDVGPALGTPTEKTVGVISLVRTECAQRSVTPWHLPQRPWATLTRWQWPLGESSSYRWCSPPSRGIARTATAGPRRLWLTFGWRLLIEAEMRTVVLVIGDV
jgi:hypothetical protein